MGKFELIYILIINCLYDHAAGSYTYSLLVYYILWAMVVAQWTQVRIQLTVNISEHLFTINCGWEW